MKIDTLLRAKYDKKFSKLKNFIVVIRHRGALDNVKEIDGAEIKDIKKDHFVLIDGTNIPAHRIIRIRKRR